MSTTDMDQAEPLRAHAAPPAHPDSILHSATAEMVKGRRLRRLARHLLRQLRRHGLRATVMEARWDLRLRTFGIWEIQLATTQDTRANITFQVLVGAPALQEIEDLRSTQPGLPASFVDARLKEGATCFLAKVDDKVACVSWLVADRHSGAFLRCTRAEAAIRSLYTLHEFRGRGIAAGLIRFTCGWAKRRGYSRILAVIDAENAPSQAAFGAAGFRKAGEIRRIGLFGPKYVPTLGRFESWWERLRIAPSTAAPHRRFSERR